MVVYGKGKRMVARQEAANARRKYVTRLSRKPYRTRRQVLAITKTPAEKKVIAKQRAERRKKMSEALAAARETVAEEARKMQAEFGLHSDKYFEQQIFQHARVTSTKRKTNPWNAFLRYELQKRNDALPAGAPRYSSSDKTVISEISAKWKAMSDEEKASVTEDLVKELDEQKEMKALSVHSVPISAFHDVRATLDSVFEELRRLHARTGIEIGLFAVRSARHQFTPPMMFATSPHVHDFFQISLGTSMDDVACSLEAYCLSGVSGLVQRSVDVIQDLRSRLTSVINQKLGQATQYTAKKMVYVGFTEHITARHGVVIENWPLPRFLAPSAIRTRLELNTLLSAWETDATRFRKLSREEWQELQEQLSSGNTSTTRIVRPVSLASFVVPDSGASGTSTRATVPESDGSTPTDGASTAASGSGSPIDSDHFDLYIPPANPRKRRSDYGKSHQRQKDLAPSPSQAVPTSVLPSGAAAGMQGLHQAQLQVRERAEDRETLRTPSAGHVDGNAQVPSPITSPHPPLEMPTTFQTSRPAYVHESTSTASAIARAGTQDTTPATDGVGQTSQTGPSLLPPPTTVMTFGGATFLFPPSLHMPPPANNSTSIIANQPHHEWHSPPTFAIDPALLDIPSVHSNSGSSTSTGSSAGAVPPSTAPSSTAGSIGPSCDLQFIEYTGHGGRRGRGGRGGRGKRARA